MNLELDVQNVLEAAQLAAYQKVAPQYEKGVFTVIRRLDSDALQTLQGAVGMSRTDLLFESWAPTQQAAAAQREAVRGALESATTSLPYTFELASGESGYDAENDRHMEPCAYSFWHETDETSVFVSIVPS